MRRIIDERIELEEKRLGLDRPFIVRSFTYLSSALSLSLGRAERLTSDKGSRQVRDVILERLQALDMVRATQTIFVLEEVVRRPYVLP